MKENDKFNRYRLEVDTSRSKTLYTVWYSKFEIENENKIVTSTSIFALELVMSTQIHFGVVVVVVVIFLPPGSKDHGD